MRRYLLALGLAVASGWAGAGGLARDWLAPRAAAFARESEGLATAMTAYCSDPTPGGIAIEPLRARWRDTLAAWETYGAVAIGPVLTLRAHRRLDFSPTRPRSILKAIAGHPDSLSDLERIGTPAKGLPALEWLLWEHTLTPATPACRYAALLALELAREADALAAAGYPAGEAELSELLNQWVGGLERLRWNGMEMPLRVARGSGRAQPDYPRGATAATAWAAQWRTLRGLAVGESGEEAYALLHYLRLRGDPLLVARWRQAVAAADAVMRGLEQVDDTRVLAAARQLAELKRLAENEVAPALGISIGFTDSDGD